MSSDFGMLTPPAQDSFDNLLEIDNEKDSSQVDPIDQFPLTAPPSVHDNTDGSDEPSSPTSPESVAQSGSRYLIHNSCLSTFIPQVAAVHQIKIPDSYSLSSCSTSVRSSSPCADSSSSTVNDSTKSVDSTISTSSTITSFTSSKRKRKGIPLRSPNREDLESDPDSISMPQDKIIGPSAIIIHRPLLLPDIIKSISQARRTKMRTRPLTRAKNKRESQELELLKLTGLDHIIDSPDSNGSIKNGEDPVINSSRRTTTINGNQKFMTTFTNSQMSRSNQISLNGGNNSINGDKQLSRTSTHNNSLSYYRTSNQRRASISVSSLSSIPTSELSDYDLNSDNFGDDEDDPDFAPSTKKRKESGNKTKVCASCRTRSTPCWRPGWRPDLFLCNSCGLREDNKCPT
ncbi:7840_t:CDS:2 [Scutellospora calospora]|uniref:7840_t:CDS:1 n=1 Tax=Scutellospora calospora TaxID=85575 RepID=A0ACA9KEK7_9GLOM|nr:7840_t:CDS:2 [Scutellospora calospora]